MNGLYARLPIKNKIHPPIRKRAILPNTESVAHAIPPKIISRITIAQIIALFNPHSPEDVRLPL